MEIYYYYYYYYILPFLKISNFPGFYMPLPHELLEHTHKRKVDNQFVDQKSTEIYVSADFLVHFACIFCFQKNILLMYMF